MRVDSSGRTCLSILRVSSGSLHYKKRSSKSASLGLLGIIVLLATLTACGGSAAAPVQQGDQNPPPLAQHTAVTTYRNDNARTGANLTETTLTPSNVSAVGFGKLAAVPVQGDVFAQPLYVPAVRIGNREPRNLIIVATEHDQVYAIDANTHAIVWHKDFLGTGGTVATLSPSDVLGCLLIAPEIGITGTPVIDMSTLTIYLVVATKEMQNGQLSYYQRIHALGLTTGEDKLTPTTITSPPDPNGLFGAARYDPQVNNQRAALLLVDQQIYVAWASNCDLGVYQGWVMSFDSGTLQLTGAWTADPSGESGGIWMGGAGPAADAAGDIYLAVGNGLSDAMIGGTNYGDSIVRLRHSTDQISALDYFIPFDWETLFDEDLDLGSGGPLLLPDQPGTAHPHLLTVTGKDGTVYLLDRDNLGHWQPDNDGEVVQSFKPSSGRCFCNPAVWNDTIYFGWMGGPVEGFHLDPIQEQMTTSPVTTTGNLTNGYPGVSPSISADGSSNGILWVLENMGPSAELRAFDAHDLSKQLYDSGWSQLRDGGGPSATFSVPTVADGLVFVGTRGELDIYGLL
jgi:hypothetical protein